MSNIENEIKENIINHGVSIGIDSIELTIDSFLDEEVVKEIPIVKNLYSVLKIGHSIRNIHFAKKLVAFLKEYHGNKIDERKFRKVKVKLENNLKYRRKVIEHILVYVDRIESEYKAKILARLFTAHINGEFDWETFLDLSSCVEDMMISDIRMMKILIQLNKKVSINQIKIKNKTIDMIRGSAERLKNFGFVEFSSQTFDSLMEYDSREVKLTKYGGKFYHTCLHSVI